jgi:hypothetical protein
MAFMGKAMARQRNFGLTARAENSLMGPGLNMTSTAFVDMPSVSSKVQVAMRKRAREARERIRKKRQTAADQKGSRLLDDHQGPQLRKLLRGAHKALGDQGRSPSASASGSGGSGSRSGGDLDSGSDRALPLRPAMLGESTDGVGGSRRGSAQALADEMNKAVHDFEDLLWKSQRKLLCYPDSPVKIYWDGLLAILVIYTSLSVPYRIGFAVEATGALGAFESFINYIFLFDILVTFRTPFLNRRGVLVTDEWKIARAYVGGNFVLDVVSSFPFDKVTSGGALARSAMLLRVIRLTRLVRLFRMTKIWRILGENKDQLQLSNNAITMIKVSLTLLVIAHFIGCSWHGILLKDRDGPNTLNWLTALNISPPPTKAIDLYLPSLYYAFTTMTTVGYGDIVAVTDGERLMAIAIMLVGGAIFGFVVGNVTQVIQNFDPVATMYKDRMSIVKAYLKDRNFPKMLFMRLRSYFSYYFEHGSMFDNSNVTYRLSGSLAMQLNFIHYDHVVRDIPFLQRQGAQMAEAMVKALKPLRLMRQEVLVWEGDMATAFYFVKAGKLDSLMLLQADTLAEPVTEQYATLESGSLVGEVRGGAPVRGRGKERGMPQPGALRI